MHQILDALVAIDAIQRGVQRFIERVGRKYQGDDLVAHFASRGRIKVAIKAVGVGEIGQDRELKPRPQHDPNKKPDAHANQYCRSHEEGLHEAC